MSKEREILQLFFDGVSQRKIAQRLKASRNTVAKVIAAAQASQLSQAGMAAIGSDQELHKFLFKDEGSSPSQEPPDCAYVHKELLKKGVTLKLLWEEYAAKCCQAGKLHLMYAQFCKVYHDYVDINQLTMHIQHKPGDKLMVDWAGTTMTLHNHVTGEQYKAYIFVATLPFSMYCYAEACLDMKEASWIKAHAHMFEFLGGSTRILVPDNLKTGIISNRKHEDPITNRAYQEMADHYRTVIMPARVLAPKDKAAVEGSVGQITTNIIAKLRNRKFFTLAEMNEAIHLELDAFNNAPFQKKEGSRTSVFCEEERPFMQSLPALPYEYASWKKATVQLNYHVTLEYQNYSVPYAYARKQVDVRLTSNAVEIYHNGQRIACHARLTGRRGQYSTIVSHMPQNHQFYSEWNGDRFRYWAKTIGPSTFEAVNKQLSSYVIEEQGYKGCLALLKLADRYGKEKLEAACNAALRLTPLPRYKLIANLLASGKLDNEPVTRKDESVGEAPSHAFMRGAAYYGGERHDQ